MKYGLRDKCDCVEVVILGSRHTQSTELMWATDHDSPGTFHYDEFMHLNLILWQFELPEDATLFALKFK